MTVVEHLSELRYRLLVSVLAILVCSAVGFILYQRILDFLIEPYRKALLALPASSRPPGAFASGLVFSSPADSFVTFLKVGLMSGFLIALPVVLWQLWAFITPGLTKRERRLAIPFVASSVVLFALGASFAFWILPRGLEFLLGFSGDALIPLLHADRYIGFLIFLILAFGLSFEFPLVLIFLAMARIVSSARLRSWRRWAYMGTVIFAAVATPTQDPYTMLLMWVPLVLFYEGAILVARLFKR